MSKELELAELETKCHRLEEQIAEANQLLGEMHWHITGNLLQRCLDYFKKHYGVKKMSKELTERDLKVLEYVKANPRKTPTEIAHALGLPNSSYVAPSLDKLSRRRGLIKRKEIICYESELEEQVQSEGNDDFNTYTITFNGKEEVWYMSNEEMTHLDAMCACETIGKTAPKLVELLEEDNAGKNRCQLLSEAGADGWSWCKDGPFGDSCYAFYVYLSNGCVYTNGRYTSRYAVCR